MEKNHECKLQQSSQASQNFQLGQLLNEINQLVIYNKNLYKSLMSMDPSIAYNLYLPKNEKGLSNKIQIELKLKQIDRLLEEKDQLNKKIEQISFSECRRKYKCEKKEKNEFNYGFLKAVWNRKKMEHENSAQQLDDLNKVVCNLKQKLKEQINRQNKTEGDNSHCYIGIKKYEKLHHQFSLVEAENLALKKRLEEQSRQSRSQKKEIESLNEILKKKCSENEQLSLKMKKMETERIREPIIIHYQRKVKRDNDVKQNQEEEQRNLNEHLKSGETIDFLQIPTLNIGSKIETKNRLGSDRQRCKKILWKNDYPFSSTSRTFRKFERRNPLLEKDDQQMNFRTRRRFEELGQFDNVL